MASPPKPWETNILPTSNNNINFTSSLPSPPESTLTTPSASTNSLSGIPEIPSRPEINPLTNTRPSALNSVYGNPTGGYGTGYGTGYGSTGYGTTGYGTAGYGTAGYGATGYGGGLYGGNSMGMYGNRMSPYGSGGLYGSSYGGGGMYGGNSMGMYGNRMNPYGNRMGPNGMPFEGGEMTFTQQMELTTQSTFQILDQVVQAFGGFAQMLESTFFATQSSFMAMIGVADQFGQLRNYLGQVFSILSLYNSAKSLLYRITGQTPPFDPSSLSVEAFQQDLKPKPSKRPLFIFLGLVVGLPYLMAKLIQRMEKNKPALQSAIGASNQTSSADIRNLEFCKAQYDYQSNTPGDLSFKKGDLVAILSKLDPQSDWWRGRTQEGRVGIFPRNYVTLISRKEPISLEAINTVTLSN